MSTCLLFSRCLMRAALVHQLGNCINCVLCDDHFFIFISFPQFIYDLFSYIINTHFFHGNVWTHNWPAPNVSGFIAQFVEHRTGNHEVTDSHPVEVLNFFQASLRNCISCVHCEDHFFIFILFPQFIYDLFSYIINN